MVYKIGELVRAFRTHNSLWIPQDTFYAHQRIGLFSLLLITFLTAVSCSRDSDVQDGFIRFYDEESIIPHTVKDSLLKSIKPQSASPIEHIVIATASMVNARALAIEADIAATRMNEEQYWLWGLLWPKNGHTVTLFFSESPNLVQIRVGRNLQLKAKAAGINSGPNYAQLQNLISVDGKHDLQAIILKIQSAMSEARVPFYQTGAYFFVTVFGDELVPFVAMPHYEFWDGMSSIAALPFYNVLNRISPNYVVFSILLTGSIVIFFSVLIFVLSLFGTRHVAPDGTLVFQATSCGGCLVYLGCFLIALIVIFPMFGFLVISANYRTEDLLMSQSIGLWRSFLVPASVHWGWILLLIIINWIAMHASILFSPELTDKELSKSVLKSLFVTPVAFFVLPAWLIIFYSCVIVWIFLVRILIGLRW